MSINSLPAVEVAEPGKRLSFLQEVRGSEQQARRLGVGHAGGLNAPSVTHEDGGRSAQLAAGVLQDSPHPQLGNHWRLSKQADLELVFIC